MDIEGNTNKSRAYMRTWLLLFLLYKNFVIMIG